MKNVAFALALSLVFTAAACKRGEQPVTRSAGETAAGDASGKGGAKAQTTTAPVGIDVGSRMPEYSAMWLDGSKFDLAGKRDKVVLLNIWATWCGPCRFEIPELQRLHNQYAAQGFEVIGVSVDESGPEAVKQFVADEKIAYPIALDPDGKIATLMQTSVLPTTVLVGRDGRILWKKQMVVTENDEELKKAIESAL
ncbi:MAG TPA: TlpA disulfide reductase family protein [Thermoanaerobaculia bacterium]|nr:TlpA disulfide reductase family protein [Thermoanaerobaculia bacterium]